LKRTFSFVPEILLPGAYFSFSVFAVFQFSAFQYFNPQSSTLGPLSSVLSPIRGARQIGGRDAGQD